MSLREYQRKRDFEKTSEPRGKRAKDNQRRFVVQKHDASRLHYDFRLELGGVLKSWAVPKGIPIKHGEKRLAVHVEDHPVSYIDFEGTIPRGSYGAGTVMVWDTGTWEPEGRAPAKELTGGKLHFTLEGEKLQGAWHLVRLRDEDQWLLIRGGESMKSVSKKSDETSALSGKSMKQLVNGDRVWKRKGNRPLPKFIEPMKAKLVDKPPVSGKWIYEIKLDGFRALALRGGSETRLFSRTHKDLGAKFPEVRDAIAGLDVEDAILDGEIVALDTKGCSSFQLLQAYELGEDKPPLFYYIFDILQLNGRDLTKQSLTDRRKHLEKILEPAPEIIRYSAGLGSDASALLTKAGKLGLEGLIGKRTDSRYEAGRRSGAWIKLKLHHEQEFVIGGYTEPEGSRKHFGALIVGVYDNGTLRFTGKVGTGFSHRLLKSLHEKFQRISRKTCPFKDLPQSRSTRYGQAITASEMKRCHWLKPELVCQVKFSEWTRDSHLRQPVFLELREDKNARDVVREKPKR